MRTEKEIREQFESITEVMDIFIKLNIHDPVFVAFHTVLDWVLQDPEPFIESKEQRTVEK